MNLWKGDSNIILIGEFSLIVECTYAKLQKAYIMNVYYSQNTFVYFGENSNPELFPYVLAKAEYSFYNVSQNNSTYYEAAKKKVS